MDIRKVVKLSVIIPCYNEGPTLGTIVEEVLAADIGRTKKEVIIVDDKSQDNSRKTIEKLAKKHPQVTGLYQPRNQGKGAALKRGFTQSTGEVVIVQDADREYDPRDYNKMLDIFREDRADIVFGSRFSGGAPRRVVYLANTVANKFMTRLSALLSGLYVSDIHTCYIMFDGDWIRAKAPKLKSKRFGFNPEIVARIAHEKNQLRICETSISYYGRTKAEGKKIGWRDGLSAIWEIIRFNTFSR
jgi:glycosyltransferase involved in cell wall biosynthesis